MQNWLELGFVKNLTIQLDIDVNASVIKVVK